MISGKSNINYVVILLAVLVLISGSATAITEDFGAFGEKKDVRACACDLTTDYITIHNTGDVTSTFIVETSGKAADWVDLAPQTFYLEPGELKKIERFIKVPCRARGEYPLNTTVRTIFDTEKVLEQTLNVQNCPNIQIIPKFSGAQQECPCTPVQYSFEVVNTGNHIETYEISVEPYSEAISLSTDFLILEPGEKHEVVVFINLECGQYGEKVFTFNALAQGTGILGQTDFTLDIKKCYEYDLVVGPEYKICQGIPNIIPFQLKNNANIANEYFITVSGEADWAYPENDTIQAWGGETKDSNIITFPPNEDEGLYTITLNSISTRGEEEKSSDILLETEKCYDYQLIETEGVLDAIECKSKNHIFVLKNIGARDTTYYVDFEGLEWLTSSAEPIPLAAGAEAEILVKGDAPCESAGEYLENIYVTIEEINQTYLEEKIVTVHAKEEAYMPDIEIPDLKIDYEGGETEIKIRNTGFETATYNLGLAASDWISIDTSSVQLAPGENATVILTAIPYEDVPEDIYAGEFTARVAGEEIEYVADFIVDLKQDRGLPMWAWGAIGGGALALIIIMVLIIILLVRKKDRKEKKPEIKEEKKPEKEPITIDKREYRKKKKEEKKTRIWPVLLILVVIALLVAGGLYYAFSSGILGGERNETESTSEETEEPVPEVIEEMVVPVTPAPEETETGVLTNAEIQESLINIDRSGIEGSGNVLRLTNETEINLPLSIKNPTDRKAVFTINTPENSWISFEQEKITIMPESTQVTNIKITPDLEALKENDYAITINTTLEGKKIYYEETLDLVLTTQKTGLLSLWPWLLAGLAALAIIILIIAFARRDKKPEIKKERPVKEKKIKAEKQPKKEKKKEKEEGRGWVPVVAGIIIIILLAALGFWAYSAFTHPESETNETVSEDAAPETTEESVETAAPAPEPKLTEDDVEGSLITIDRSGVPGEGNVFKLEQEQYDIPMTISNPTDRKARFTVNTSNESWVVFDQYKILVEPESSKDVVMSLVPDMDALEKNDYRVTINTKLEGQKIDYEEELDFVLKKNRGFEASYWLYALAGLIIIGLIILIAEIVKKSRENKDKTPVKASAKETKEKKVKKEKDVEQINKELADLRKSTVLKLKKSSY
ncbi:hypothetical protein KY359_04925 [Candidatus Woesearchaeota archaeon]|nr:hypothetical protein [Candidatus Woesearchaeota archaeon]